MSNLSEVSQWENGIYQLEETDRIQGGESGISNTQARQLGNRTKYLYDNKADLNSPQFTGVPTAPSVLQGTNTEQIANMAAVYQATQGFGLGSESSVLITDLNGPTATGFYRFLSTASNIPASFAGNLIHVQNTVNNATQVVSILDSTNRSFVRTKVSSTWTTWKELASTTGVTDASSAGSGIIGQMIESNASAVSLSNGAATTITSVSLPAGEWDVYGEVQQVYSATGSSGVVAGIGTVANTDPGFPYKYANYSVNGGTVAQVATPRRLFKLSAATTVFLISAATFSSGTCAAAGYLHARRIR